MIQSRRNFILRTSAGLAMLSAGSFAIPKSLIETSSTYESKPWIELSKEAYQQNAAQISRMAGGKPIVAVLKNNAYGLGETQVARLLDQSPHVHSVAVVKDESALAIRSSGISKPIILMGDFDNELFHELYHCDITLSVHSRSSFDKITRLANSDVKPLKVALYIDTGLGRMGIPYQETVELAVKLAQHSGVTITQTFSTLTSPNDFATEQIGRFEEVIGQLDRQNITTGLRHLAPSYSLLDLPNSHQQAVRPGILLHGSFPLPVMAAANQYPLQVAYRLKAPVIRLVELKSGDTIGFSRFYKVEKREWIATLPIGWADGYDSGAENGAKVLFGDQLYPVVNVNASHTNISLGERTSVKIGDVATLIGPDQPEITPEGFGKLVKGHNYLQINYKESIPKQVYASF